MTGYIEKLVDASGRLGGWNDLPFFATQFTSVTTNLSENAGPFLPAAESVFAALENVAPDDVRVVILGQDPYPTPGHANGLAFSVLPDVKPLPRSLSNIFKEMADDIGAAPPHGNLDHWAEQGVLLLNSALTVCAGNAGSHAKIGWSELTKQIVKRLADKDKVVWVLWGKHAQAYRPWIDAGDGKETLVIESVHPSPLSARKGFFGSKPFSRTNEHLETHGLKPIRWTP